MTTLPLPPTRPLSVAEYVALGETEARYELQEGSLVMSPRPTRGHMRATLRLAAALDACAPPELEVFPEIDIDLALGPSGGPGWVRAPDVVVARRSAVAATGERALLRPGDLVLVAEIVSPGSKRTDTVVKRSEYADAGIPCYWIVELDPEPVLTACHLGGPLGYVDEGPVTGTFSTGFPFPVTIDLNALR